MIFKTNVIASLGWVSSLLSPILAAALQPKALDPRATPYTTRILDTGTTFVQENNGVWQLIE
jgi:hypothetical protein